MEQSCSKKTIPNTSDQTELMSLCSCDGCETVRCFSTKKSTINTDDDETFSKTCIYFTNITIKQSKSNTDSTRDDTSNKNTKDNISNRIITSCETCRKEKEDKKKSKNLNNCESLPKTNTINTACRICKKNFEDVGSENDAKDSLRKRTKNIQDADNMVDQNCIPNLRNVINHNAKESNDQTKLGISANVPNLNKKEPDSGDKKSDTINKIISEWQSYKSSALGTKKSVCEICLRNINKLNNDVDTFNKGLFSEVHKFNNNINKVAESKFTSPENKQTNKSKCVSNIPFKCSTCATKYGTIPEKNVVSAKSTCKQDIQSKGELCGITEIICKKQSNCKMCGRYVNVTKQTEKSDTGKTQPSNQNESIPKKEKPRKFLCKFCRRDNNTYGKKDAANIDPTMTQVTNEVKSNGEKNNESYYKTFNVNNVLTPTQVNSKCSNCENHFEVFTDDSEKQIHKMNNEVDAKLNFKKTNSSCFAKLARENKAPILDKHSFILCTCKNHDDFNHTSLTRTLANVHNTTVNYVHDINPSTAKLSAQIMNVPYEDFQESFNHMDQESFNHIDQDNVVIKPTMNNNISDEIIKRIKDVYKACSCKICECIVGKSLRSNNECNCKPCNCDDCKSYKNFDIFSELEEERIKMLNQYCKCTPCDCVKCSPPRTYIAARFTESLNANNCTCTPCQCAECERNYFPLSTHITQDMSTGMMGNCRCDQCLDQRCRGAGGAEDCHCEMPSKAIFKPVEKDSNDYDIRRASVFHQINMKKPDHFDTIAMYASVPSNFTKLGTLKEACSCEECECFACKNEDGKLSVETILKPQQELHVQSIKTNYCVCKSCECEVCSYNKNIPECDVKYQDAECACGECNCINCQTMTKPSTTSKEGSVAKPIGKIYYKNSFSGGSQQCDDIDLTVNGSSLTYGDKQVHRICMNTALNKNYFIKNCDCDPVQLFDSYNKHIEQYQNKDQRTCLLTKTFCDFQDIEDNQLPARDTSIDYKNSPDDCSINSKYFDKDSNEFNFTAKAEIFKSDERFHGIETKQYQNRYLEDSEYSLFAKIKGHREINLSNYKPNCSKSTLRSCLKDVLAFHEDVNLSPFKIVEDLDESKINYPTNELNGISGYGQEIKPYSCYQNVFENKLESDETSIKSDVHIKNFKNDSIWDNMPIVLNSSKLTLHDNQIDYESVHKTLEEAKDFSGQLIQLLEKYDRANNDFQSVSEKLKVSHGLDVLSKLSTAKCALSDNDTFENTMNGESNRKSYDEKTSCNHYSLINNLKDISDLTSTHASIIQRNIPKDSNIERSNQEDKVQNDLKYLKTIDSKEISVETKKTIQSRIVAEDNIIEQPKTLLQLKLEETMTQDIHNNPNIESNADQLNKLRGLTSLNFALHNIIEPANNTQNKIDTLTNQLSEMIKENVLQKYEEIILSADLKKYDKSVSVYDVFDNAKSQENRINNYQDWSISKKNYYLTHNPDVKDSFTSPISEVVPKLEMQSMYIQTSLERQIDKPKVDKLTKVKSAFSVPRNKTLQVEKESNTVMMDIKNNDQPKPSTNTLKSKTELDLISQFNVAHCSRLCELPRSKCSCENLKVGSLSGRRVSDHTVMVKWTKPKEMEGVQGYELLVDGRPVQKIIDSARCMAVVTCLPNCEKVLLTMRTVLDVPLRSGHKPTVTIVYRPRLKKIRTESVTQDAN